MLDTQNQNHHRQHHPPAPAILTLLQVVITLQAELRNIPKCSHIPYEKMDNFA